MRSIILKNKSQFKSGGKLIIKTILDSGIRVKFGSLKEDIFMRTGTIDLIGTNEDKVWEIVSRKLKKRGYEIW